MKRKAQQFSFDLMTALIVFAVVIAVIVGAVVLPGMLSSGEKVQSIKAESSTLASRFVATKASEEADPFSFIVNNKIDPVKLNAIITKDYEQVKRELGIRNDFVIYFMEEDGSLAELKAATGVYCYGGPGVTVMSDEEVPAEVPCCSKVNRIFYDPEAGLNEGCEKLSDLISQ